MSSSGKFLRIGMLVVAAAAFAGSARADALTEQAKALLDRHDWQAAYALLIPEEPSRAGDAEFDLLLGIAAVESGKHTSAVFALERVLAVEPNHPRARAEIARAYFALGETKTARKEFETVRGQDVPDGVRRTIDRFLSAIEQLESAGKTVVRGYAEITVGYDTNVNAGPQDRQGAVPGGGAYTLAPTSVGLKDSFTTAAAGLTLRSPLARNLDLVANLAGHKRINGTYDIYDMGGAEGNVGIAYTQDRNVFTLSYQLASLYVDNERHRDSSGITAQIQHNLDSRNQVSLFFQHGWLRYPGQSLRDADRTVAGLNAAHALPDRKTVFYGGIYGGTEDETHAGVPHLGHTLWGIRAGGQHQYRDDLAFFANLGYENRRYGGPDFIFLKDRDDGQASVGAGVVWNVTPKWQLTSQYVHTRNSSNIPINTYKRDMLSVSVRHSF